MTELRRRMMADMKLHGLAPGTQKVYLKAVQHLAAHYGRPPDQLSEQQLRDYFTYLVENKKVPSSTLRTEIFGVKFLFDKTLQRSWPTLKFLRARPRAKLPVVLDREEARGLIGLIRCPTVRMCATMMYSCDLRISEALGLQVADIDSKRMVVTVRAGKGNKDRHVPLPRRTLELLRDYWRAYQPRNCLLVTRDSRPLADRRYVGGRIGILAVLQTWTATLTYHPHAHLLVPAGGGNQHGEWVAARSDYLVPVEALALIFRGMFLQMVRRALPRQHLPRSLWTKKWHVYCEPTVQGTERVLQYLGRYIYRVAFANSRLVCIDGGQVTFRYQDRKKRQWKTKTLPATEFIGRFLQHVLPRGTHKVRYYGIWNPSQRCLLRRVQLVTGPLQIPSVTQHDPAPPTEGTPDPPVENRRKCPCCGEGRMVLVETIRRRIRAPP